MNKYILRIKAILLLAIFIIGTTSSTVSAIDDPDGTIDESFYASNKILWYNPLDEKTCAIQTDSTIISVDGANNAEKIWNFFIQNGLQPHQAAGVMGNLQVESGLDPGIEERVFNVNGQKGYGLAQWTAGRRDALVAAAAKANVKINDLVFQLNFLVTESKSRTVSSAVARQGYGQRGQNEWETLKAQTNIEGAVVFFHNNFEVSSQSPSQVLKDRGGAANKFLEQFGGTTTEGTINPTNSSAASSCTSSNFQGGNLQQTLKAYAWPQYHKANYTELQPAYKEAVAKRVSEGLYVGGGKYPGVDCGGFVSTLLVNSGFEPNYNASQANTVFQEEWVKNNWQRLGSGSQIDAATLQPGDVAFEPGHTFVYVGDVEGFDSKIASASYSAKGTNWRAPMAGREQITDSGVTWYRKK